MKKFSKGQSTLEYVIILAAVVGAIILAAGILKTHLKGDDTKGYQKLINTMETKATSVTF